VRGERESARESTGMGTNARPRQLIRKIFHKLLDMSSRASRKKRIRSRIGVLLSMVLQIKKNRGSTKYNPEIKSHCKSASKCIYSFVGVYACSHPRWARVQDCKKMKQKDLKCFDSTLNSKKTTGMISNNNKVRSQFSFVEYPV
jgi:hypothetical protein